jgi:predicted nucleic-acid-binding Zn-ribbon protein
MTDNNNNNNNNNNNTNSKCPKCSSNMVQHSSLVSMPLTSSTQQNAQEDMKKMNIEDQDANFIFKFISCEKCGYSEFFLNDRGIRI